MKLELTIKTDYLPEWGVYEGIRELVQNGKDAETQLEAPLKIDHYKSNVLRIENSGATLPHEALLFGFTTKQGCTETIGQFGEGLKLGVLALVRAGYPVTIRSGSEVWKPSIQRSEKFDSDVLVFDISKGREFKNRVRVEVSNINTEKWEEYKSHFLFLNKFDKDLKIDTAYGSLLLDKERVGNIYVKGIYVNSMPDYNYGYDFQNAKIDRDRRLLNTYDLKYQIRNIWAEATKTRPDLFEPLFKLLEEKGPELDDVCSWNATYFSSEVLDAALLRFQETFGKEAIAVANLSESRDLEHLGKRGVIVPESMRALVQSKIGDFKSSINKLQKEVIKQYSYCDLDDTEKSNLETAVKLVYAVLETESDKSYCSFDNIDIVEFRSDSLLGQFKDNRILIAKKMLSTIEDTLHALIHELCHLYGKDGEKDHVITIEQTWKNIVGHLLESKHGN